MVEKTKCDRCRFDLRDVKRMKSCKKGTKWGDEAMRRWGGEAVSPWHRLAQLHTQNRNGVAIVYLSSGKYECRCTNEQWTIGWGKLNAYNNDVITSRGQNEVLHFLDEPLDLLAGAVQLLLVLVQVLSKPRTVREAVGKLERHQHHPHLDFNAKREMRNAKCQMRNSIATTPTPTITTENAPTPSAGLWTLNTRHSTLDTNQCHSIAIVKMPTEQQNNRTQG